MTFKVRDTPAYCQKPGLAIGARARVVVMSIRRAVAPPWRLPMRLQREGVTRTEKVQTEVGPEGVGLRIAE